MIEEGDTKPREEGASTDLRLETGMVGESETTRDQTIVGEETAQEALVQIVRG